MSEERANGNRLNPLVGRPYDRLVKVIAYALWGEIAGPCPTNTAHALDEWRETALRAYQHDNGFHMKVNAVASHALDAARAFCAPNIPTCVKREKGRETQ